MFGARHRVGHGEADFMVRAHADAVMDPGIMSITFNNGCVMAESARVKTGWKCECWPPLEPLREELLPARHGKPDLQQGRLNHQSGERIGKSQGDMDRDQTAEAVPEEHRPSLLRMRSHMLAQDRADIVHIVREANNIAAPAAGPAVASKIYGENIEPAAKEELRKRIVAAAMLAESVEQEQRLLRRRGAPATIPEMRSLGGRPRSFFEVRLIRHVEAAAGRAV